ASQQVHRNGITRESIHGKHIKGLRQFSFQGQTRVAEDDSDLGSRISQKAELAVSKLKYQRIDYVKDIPVAAATACGTRPRAQTNDSDAHGTSSPTRLPG